MLQASPRLPLLSLSVSLALGSLALGIAHCGSGDASGPPLVRVDVARAPAVLADMNVAVTANNAFAVDYFAKASAAADGNFLTSPLSAHVALTMAYAGARGNTATQMATALHLPGTSIFSAQNALTQAITGRGAAAFAQGQQVASQGGTPVPPLASDYVLDLVNNVWGQAGYPWATPFLSILAASYGTGVYTQDFKGNPSGAVDAINQWVSGQTAGTVNPLLGGNAIDSTTRLVLVNAIHLKLPWASAFDTSQTMPGTFTRGDGSSVQTAFMHQSFLGNVGYAETDEAQLVSLALYGEQVSVVFALPKHDLATLRAALTESTFAVPAASPQVELAVPRFDVTSPTFSLKAPLEALGMTDAFDNSTANFNGMSPTSPDGVLYVKDVLQEATLQVAELGVAATAATAVVVDVDGGIDVAQGQPVKVTLDHPFLVAVVDASGAIVFLGQIDDPTAT